MPSTRIEWAEHVWNPIRGCSVVSAGCVNCYAASVAYRFSGPGQTYEGLAYQKNGRAHWTGKVRLVPEKLEEPLRRKKPTRYFVNSMSDWLHPEIPDEFIDKMMAVALLTPQHQYLFLTKRPERGLEYMKNVSYWRIHDAFMEVARASGHDTLKDIWPPPNVWGLVSVEDQKSADDRIPLLLNTPFAVRGVSYEPALGPVDFTEIWPFDDFHTDALDTPDPTRKLDWIIAGGESGPGARPAHPDWFRQARDQCVAADVAFLFKQWGEHAPAIGMSLSATPWSDERFVEVEWDYPKRPLVRPPAFMYRVGKKAAGRLLDGREWDQYPDVLNPPSDQ